MPRVLVVDDDFELCACVKRALVEQGFVVDTANTGLDGIQMLTLGLYDAIVLDWNLPDITGLHVCKKLRSQAIAAPILFLTGMNGIDYKEGGLDAGADDYLVKPFEMRELLARLRTLIRRAAGQLTNDLVANGAMLDVQKRTVTNGFKSVRLTQRECALLEYLIRNTNSFFTASRLKESVWPADAETTDESVRTCMKMLRRKLGEIEKFDLIKTVSGSGYIIET